MATYSTGTPPTNATKLQDFNSVLNILPDNTSKLIAPKDVRDSLYTTWENIAFKPTTAGGSSEYIGIDQESLQEKILIGKKSIGGQYVMNSSLLNTDVDVFFYNTKTEPQANYHTTVAFLAGTGSNVNGGSIFAPYLKSTVVANPGYSNTLDFDIYNPTYYDDGTGTYSGGNVNVASEWGFVTLNGLRMPTFLQNTVGSSIDGYVLKYRWVGGQAYAKWEASASASTSDTLYSTGTFSISGCPVGLNGLPIDFTSSVPVPVAIGGVSAGSTFSSMPLTEVVRMILYPYIAPVLTTSMVYSLIEIGDFTTQALQRLNYSIVKNSTYPITSLVSNNYSQPLPSPGNINNGTTIGQITPNFNTAAYSNDSTAYATFSWTITLQDSYPTIVPSTANFTSVIPWFYGSATVSATTTVGLNSINNILGTSTTSVLGKLTKLIADPATSASSGFNKTVTLSTAGLPLNQGYLYFGYPSNFPSLVSIIDPNGYNVTTSWMSFTISTVQSANGYWSNKTYRFYIFVGSSPGANTPLLTTVGSSPNYSGNFQFKFA
jgi:hypothetical protein